MNSGFRNFLFIFACFGAFDSPADAAPNDIKWRLENPLRYFSDSKPFELHRGTYQALSVFEKLNPILSAERRLARAYPLGWAGDLIDHVCNGKFSPSGGCDVRQTRVTPRHHMVVATIENGKTRSSNCS